jgi:hypothetical protein
MAKYRRNPQLDQRFTKRSRIYLMERRVVWIRFSPSVRWLILPYLATTAVSGSVNAKFDFDFGGAR